MKESYKRYRDKRKRGRRPLKSMSLEEFNDYACMHKKAEALFNMTSAMLLHYQSKIPYTFRPAGIGKYMRFARKKKGGWVKVFLELSPIKLYAVDEGEVVVLRAPKTFEDILTIIEERYLIH